MSEIGTGLQNATGIRNAIARAGYAFVEASDMRTALRPLRHAGRLAGLRRRAGTISTSTPTWATAAATAAGASASGPPTARARSCAAPHQPHYQGLDYNTLNGGIERWFKPIADEIGDGASHAHHPGILPRPLQQARARRRRAGTSRSTSSASRPARRARQAHARGHASRRRRLCAGAADRPPQHRAAAPRRCTTSTSARWAASP